MTTEVTAGPGTQAGGGGQSPAPAAPAQTPAAAPAAPEHKPWTDPRFPGVDLSTLYKPDEPPMASDAPAGTAEAPTEAAPEAPPPEPETKPEDPFASRFEKLAQAEKRLQEDRESLRRELAELKAMRGEQDLRALAKKDRMAALKELGITYEDLTQDVLSGGKPAQKSPEIAALEARLDAMQNEARMANLRGQISTLVAGGGDRFEIIRDTGNEPLVMEYLVQKAKMGVQLSLEQAAEEVESHLEAQAKALLKVQKLSRNNQPNGAHPTPAPRPEANGHRSTSPKTLGNAAASTPPAPKQTAPRTPEERLKAAARHIKYD